MSRADWRTPGAYEELRSLDAPGFAWEYLRRNSDFQQDRRKLERTARRGVLSQAEADAFARRWGVRFRKRRRDKQPQFRSMDRGRPAKRGRPDPGSRLLGRRPEFRGFLNGLRRADSGRVPKPRQLLVAVHRPRGVA
jgi:hypothetical protein